MSRGAAGVAMLHIERAATGLGDWSTAHVWLQTATRTALAGGADAALLFGTPALAFALHGAAHEPRRYQRVLNALDANVATITQRRLTRAHARIDRGDRPALAEFDLINGLTGLGAHLRRRHRDNDLLRQILVYLVRLTRPLAAGDPLPGWWTPQPPTGRRANADGTGGHGNLSIAHGISGPLALLSLTALDGLTVDGQPEAIDTICSWLDDWRQHHPGGPWWPEIITLDELRTGRPNQTHPHRPSWCYGTPGHARAQQLAGLARNDPHRQHTAEHAMTGCLTDPAQLRQITTPGLCHGTAGLLQTTWRIAADASTPRLRPRLPDFAEQLLADDKHDGEIGLLDGTTGQALALMTAAADQPPATKWDAFMLLT
jgi:hypothetical protein